MLLEHIVEHLTDRMRGNMHHAWLSTREQTIGTMLRLRMYPAQNHRIQIVKWFNLCPTIKMASAAYVWCTA